MKKKNPLLILLPVLLCAVMTGIYAYVFVLKDDTTAPELFIDSELLEVSVYAGEEELLAGVRAADETDGDLTSSILIEGIANLNENHEAVITYAACDAAGNVSKISRTLRYTDYESPVFLQNRSMTIAANSSPDLLAYMDAEDMIDGDIGSRIKGTLISDTTSLSYPGIHQVEFRVSNSLGDTQRITLPVEVYENGAYNATVDLGDDYLIYLRRGAVFKPEEFLEKLVVGNTEYSLKNQNPEEVNLTKDEIAALGNDRELEVRTYINNYVDPEDNIDPFVGIANVEIDSEVINTIPGIYSVSYTVNYEDRYTGYARLNVVVEE